VAAVDGGLVLEGADVLGEAGAAPADAGGEEAGGDAGVEAHAAGDLADVGGHGYTYLINGNTPAANWTGLFERGERVLFLPDQHLGRNTAYKMGVPLDEMVVWDPNEVWGGLDAEQVKAAGGTAAARRAGRLGDGYFPARTPSPGLLDEMRRAALAAGRDPKTIEITVAAPTGLAEIEALARQGVARVAVPVSAAAGLPAQVKTPEDVLRYGKDVIARFR